LRQCKRAAAEMSATRSLIAKIGKANRHFWLFAEGGKEDAGEETDLDRAMIPRAQTRRLEHTSLAAISEFASAILSIEAPPLLTEAEILFAFFIFPLVS